MQDQARVLEYLKERYEGRSADLKAIPLINGTEYVALCTHSEILRRVWFDLPGVLPENCRDIAYGNPLLRHPRTGVIFAIGLSISTYYWLRMSSRTLEEVQFEESDFIRVMTVNRKEKKTLDLREVLGPKWIFGAFREGETKWCRAAYEEASEDCK
jgi:hypothetical protein